MLNKRDFLIGGASAALATAAVASTDAAGTATRAAPREAATGPSVIGRTQRHPDLARPSAARFEAYVGESFQSGDATLRLAAVDRRASGAGVEQFTLRFEAVAGTTAHADLHLLRHAASGQSIPMHLQPSGDTLDAHFSLLA